MLMSLGLFVFEMGTLPYQELARRTSWRHGTTARLGARPASQFMGPGDDCVTVSGLLVPEVAGSIGALQTLRDMGDAGEVYPLVAGDGTVLGSFTIQSIDERQGQFYQNGVPRKADFNIELARVD